MNYAKIIGSGVCLPPYPATNEDIANFFPPPPSEEWTPAWVERRLGIRERRNAFDFRAGHLRMGFHDGDMAWRAALAALEDAKIRPDEVDRILYATSTPEHLLPDPACILHHRLGLGPDASAIGATAVGCGGFVYLMDIADSEIRSGKYGTILAVGSVSVGPYINAIAQTTDPEERNRQLLANLVNAYIFGEGAGALVFRASDEESGVLHTYTGASGDSNPVVFEGGGSRHPATHETVKQGIHRFNMNVGLVKQAGPAHFKRAIDAVLKRSKMPLEDIKHFIFHQVNHRLLKRITTAVGIPWEKVVVHVDHYGNLDTATLPVAFHEAKAEGRIKPGDLILFAAIGAGWQYGSAIVRA